MEEGYFTFVLQPYRNPAGEVEGLLSHSVEVTDVVRSRQRVEALVAERDAFLAAASHDLKNPLAAIKATAQFLRRYLERTGGSDPARLATGLATIQETVDRMLGLVNELLDVARLRMGQTLDLDRQTTDLVELARRIVAAQQQATERHRLRVESAVDALVGEWDAARLERVLGNLLENAIKYSPDGGTVVVELAEEDGQALVRVRDQGIGIPLADRERIFEPFQRGSNVGQGIAGTGIGLSGSRQIVEQHGGAISVESEEGAGSTFTVRLPLAGREE
jgi:signal transduction histidine kinase